MIKNRTAQLVFLSVACTIGALGIISSVGLFEASFRWDFYVYFTNVSNYFCIAILFTELIRVIKRNDDDYIQFSPVLKFIGLISIILTFLVFNGMLAPKRPINSNLTFRSVSLHILIPVLYVVDWFLFYERKKTTWKYPFYALIFPACYMLFVIIHAACLSFDTSILNFAGNEPLIYPYFFINFETQKVIGVLIWLAIIFVVLLSFGYLFYGLDRIQKKKIEK